MRLRSCVGGSSRDAFSIGCRIERVCVNLISHGTQTAHCSGRHSWLCLQRSGPYQARGRSVLFEARRYRGAIYLAGYAVECLLKWAITERCEITYLP